MQIEVREYDEKYRNAWNRFVDDSGNGTLYHDLDFLDYHPQEKFQTLHLMFFNSGGELLSVMPGAVNGSVFSSPYGASYGGFVLPIKCSLKTVFSIVESFLDYIRKFHIEEVRLTLPPKNYLAIPDDYLEFTLLKNHFQYSKRELTSALCTMDVDDPLALFRSEHRTSMRKAKKSGIEIKESQDLEAFYEILEINQRERHDSKPTHTKEELTYLHNQFPDRVRIFLAYHDQRPVAGILIFICNPRVALTFYICHLPEFQQFRSINYLMYEVIRWCSNNHYVWLDLGTSTRQMEPVWGVLEFKEGLGAKGYFRDSFVRKKEHCENIYDR